MDDDQLLRYARHILLPGIEIEGQKRLLAARVLIMGLGGLGSPVSLYLAASGVGHLTLVDFDTVDLSNLQRQIVHTTASIGMAKVLSAKSTLLDINPEIQIRTIGARLSEEELQHEVAAADVVVDCTDNFDIRFAINDACLLSGTRLVSGAAIRFEGQLLTVDPQDTNSPCYRCLYQDAPDTSLSCAESGIAAPLVGVVGTLQALETIKLIVGTGESLVGYLLTFDAKVMTWQKLRLPRNPACIACGQQAPAGD